MAGCRCDLVEQLDKQELGLPRVSRVLRLRRHCHRTTSSWAAALVE
jgi:hypothetical protein